MYETYTYHKIFTRSYTLQYTSIMSWWDSHHFIDCIHEGDWKIIGNRGFDIAISGELVDDYEYWDNGIFGDVEYHEFMNQLLIPGRWKI